MRKATVIASRMLTPSVRELTFLPDGEFLFDPGQWVSFRIPAGPGAAYSRSYSIASGPRADGSFDVAVTRVEGGPGSNYLHSAPHGEVLSISQAQGFFTMPQIVRPVVMVATGTGVSPFRSILQAYSKTGPLLHPVTLLLGARTEEDLLYGQEFEALEHSMPGFHFVSTLSRGSLGWQGRRGYVQLHVPELVRLYNSACDVYICGVSKMVKDVRTLLKSELNLGKDQIHTERYD